MSKLGGQIVKFFYKGDETGCQIVSEEKQVLAEAKITRFHKDKPNKRLARNEVFRRAMTQAVDTNSMSKETRKAVWSDFRTMINQPV